MIGEIERPKSEEISCWFSTGVGVIVGSKEAVPASLVQDIRIISDIGTGTTQIEIGTCNLCPKVLSNLLGADVSDMDGRSIFTVGPGSAVHAMGKCDIAIDGIEETRKSGKPKSIKAVGAVLKRALVSLTVNDFARLTLTFDVSQDGYSIEPS